MLLTLVRFDMGFVTQGRFVEVLDERYLVDEVRAAHLQPRMAHP